MTLHDEALRREPVSIVCVFNKVDVLHDCLERSVEVLRAEAPDTELIAVDNTAGAFPTAGAALRHGASLARHDYFVFAHQDVYLHSLVALELAAGQLADHPEIGMIGSVGIAADGRILGRMRDRVVLLGDSLSEPTDVDSLDEVLFMIPRAVLDSFPLADRRALGWHAYAVEYGLRLRSEGLRVTAGDIPITHNSLTVNLDRLDVAHRDVGDAHSSLLPIRTTCGVIRSPKRALPGSELLGPHRWRYRWLRDSIATQAVRGELAGVPVVLSDITIDIDDVLEATEPLTVVNNAGELAFADESSGPLALTRSGRHITVQSTRISALAEAVARRAANESMLVTNLDADRLSAVAPAFEGAERIAGFHGDKFWILGGPAAAAPPHLWNARCARPLSLRFASARAVGT